MKIAYYISWVSIWALLVSCDRFIEVELPDQETKLVLNSLLENTDTLKVFLTKSRSVLEGREWEKFEFVKNATVLLKDQNGRIQPFTFKDSLDPLIDDDSYQLPNPGLTEGETYEIIAEAQGFPRIVSSQRLPEKVSIKSISLEKIGVNQNFPETDLYEITLKFNDLPDKNYYEILGKSIANGYYINQGDTVFYQFSETLDLEPRNPLLAKDHLRRGVILFSDNFLDGENSEVVFRTWLRNNSDLEVNFYLANVSEAYYKYYDTADLQWQNRGDILSQPVLVFNNIENGLGIFKARNVDRKSVILKASGE